MVMIHEYFCLNMFHKQTNKTNSHVVCRGVLGSKQSTLSNICSSYFCFWHFKTCVSKMYSMHVQAFIWGNLSWILSKWRQVVKFLGYFWFCGMSTPWCFAAFGVMVSTHSPSLLNLISFSPPYSCSFLFFLCATNFLLFDIIHYS